MSDVTLEQLANLPHVGSYDAGVDAFQMEKVTVAGLRLLAQAVQQIDQAAVEALIDEALAARTEAFVVAVSDEATAITSGTGVLTFRFPYAFEVSEVRASLSTASSSGAVVVDVNVAGVSMFDDELTVDEGETTSVGSASPAVIAEPSIADDAPVSIDIDSAGSGATGLKVTFIGTRP